MNNKRFEVNVHAKWILAGEHAVLRGHPALVFPVPDRHVKLTFLPTNQPLHADFLGPNSKTLLTVFWGLMEESLKRVNQNYKAIRGKFTVFNTIPMGAGLGFSATLCVAITQWIAFQGWIEPELLFEFSRQLEDFFHGQSSGVDIAGALAKQGVYFKGGLIEPIKMTWQPIIYLSYSGRINITAHSIRQVKAVRARNAVLADQLDTRMKISVDEARVALTTQLGEVLDRQARLAKAINQANTCFEAWGLNTNRVSQHLSQLRRHGAIATKPTGAGNGGYVLSLWKQQPINLPFELLPAV